MNKPFHIDEATLAKLRKSLGSDEEAMSDFASQAIREKLAREPAAAPKPSAYELGKHLFGKYDSGRSDISERADEVVGQIVREKHRHPDDRR